MCQGDAGTPHLHFPVRKGEAAACSASTSYAILPLPIPPPQSNPKKCGRLPRNAPPPSAKFRKAKLVKPLRREVCGVTREMLWGMRKQPLPGALHWLRNHEIVLYRPFLTGLTRWRNASASTNARRRSAQTTANLRFAPRCLPLSLYGGPIPVTLPSFRGVSHSETPVRPGSPCGRHSKGPSGEIVEAVVP
jgi:hypothetical protein